MEYGVYFARYFPQFWLWWSTSAESLTDRAVSIWHNPVLSFVNYSGYRPILFTLSVKGQAHLPSSPVGTRECYNNWLLQFGSPAVQRRLYAHWHLDAHKNMGADVNWPSKSSSLISTSILLETCHHCTIVTSVSNGGSICIDMAQVFSPQCPLFWSQQLWTSVK